MKRAVLVAAILGVVSSGAQAQWVSGLSLGGGSVSGDMSIGGALVVTGAISGASYGIGAANALSFKTFDSGTAGDTLAIGRSGGTAPASAAYQAVAIGALTMSGDGITTAAVKNTAVGYSALAALTSGANNTAIGNSALDAITSGNNSTAVGFNALGAVTTGGANTGIGQSAGAVATGGSGVFVGSNAGLIVSSGANNTIIGAAVGSTVLTTGSTSNTIGIGAGSTAVWSATGAGTPSTSASTIAGTLAVSSTTASTSPTTGGVLLSGGLGVVGRLNVGGTNNEFGNAAGVPAHISSSQLTAPALTSCGTGSPSIVGTDTAGTITTGTSAAGCVITFNVAYAAAPHCVVNWQTTPAASQSYTVSASAITLTQTSASGRLVNYVCVGRAGG